MGGPAEADAGGAAQPGESAADFAGEPDAFGRLWTPHRMVYIKGENKPTHGDAGDDCWTDADRAVIAAADALHERHDLDDAEWSALVGVVGEEGAIDLLLLCGWYHAISFAVRALRLPLEPGTAPIGAR